VIEDLGSLFAQDATSKLLSSNALLTADRTVRECSSVFEEVSVALKKSKKNTLGRLMLPFREPKIELLRSHIDKLKSTLQLLMQVLIHAHQVAAQKYDREAEAAHREQIKELLQNNKNSTKRYEESLMRYSMSEDSTIADAGESTVKSDPSSGAASSMISIATVKSTITMETLDTCIQHVRMLLRNIRTLQLALEQRQDGADPSEQQQRLIDSYFRAREHLDSALLGNFEDHLTPSVDDDVAALRPLKEVENNYGKLKFNRLALKEKAETGPCALHGQIEADMKRPRPPLTKASCHSRTWALSDGSKSSYQQRTFELEEDVFAAPSEEPKKDDNVGEIGVHVDDIPPSLVFNGDMELKHSNTECTVKSLSVGCPQLPRSHRPVREKTQPPTSFSQKVLSGRRPRKGDMSSTIIDEPARLLRYEEQQMYLDRTATEQREQEEAMQQRYTTRTQPRPTSHHTCLQKAVAITREQGDIDSGERRKRGAQRIVPSDVISSSALPSLESPVQDFSSGLPSPESPGQETSDALPSDQGFVLPDDMDKVLFGFLYDTHGVRTNAGGYNRDVVMDNSEVPYIGSRTSGKESLLQSRRRPTYGRYQLRLKKDELDEEVDNLLKDWIVMP
jgi:hypothetical protein